MAARASVAVLGAGELAADTCFPLGLLDLMAHDQLLKGGGGERNRSHLGLARATGPDLT